MAAEIVATRVFPALGTEDILIMDDYGTDFHLIVKLTDAAFRQSYIDAAIAQQSGNQAALEEYAATHKIDVSAHKAEGLQKKAQAKQEGSK